MKILIVLHVILVAIFCLFCLPDIRAGNGQSPFFKVLVVASPHPDHGKMIRQAKPFLYELGGESNFSVDFSLDPAQINDTNLSRYQVFIQLHLAPFEMSYQQQAALQKFIEQGKGWVRVHAAGLTGRQFIDSSTVYWQWYQDFFGGVVYSPHPDFQRGTVVVEDRTHPVTRNLTASFSVWDEWYEFDRSPRPNVRVLATADESTFKQVVPMGDHPMWPWFSEFMGGIRFNNYIAGLATGLVRVEDKDHPSMKNVPASFPLIKEEWYTWDKSPRPNVHVIAHVDESSYAPQSDIKMGDHPVIWTNESCKARNIYIFMGHHPDLFKSEAYTTLVRNAIFWTAGN